MYLVTRTYSMCACVCAACPPPPQVVFLASEIAAAKACKPPGLTLLGFKPLAALRDQHQLTHRWGARACARAGGVHVHARSQVGRWGRGRLMGRHSVTAGHARLAAATAAMKRLDA